MESTKKKINNNYSNKTKYLSFYLNNEIYAIKIIDICEVNRLANIFKTKTLKDNIIGMINFHGKTTPVLNLKKILKMNNCDKLQSKMWFAYKTNDNFICFAFDKLSKIVEVEDSIIDEVSNIESIHEKQNIKCFIRLNNQLIPVLDLANIYNTNLKYIKNNE